MSFGRLNGKAINHGCVASIVSVGAFAMGGPPQVMRRWMIGQHSYLIYLKARDVSISRAGHANCKKRFAAAYSAGGFVLLENGGDKADRSIEPRSSSFII
jgi:hypothetical protein